MSVTSRIIQQELPPHPSTVAFDSTNYITQRRSEVTHHLVESCRIVMWGDFLILDGQSASCCAHRGIRCRCRRVFLMQVFCSPSTCSRCGPSCSRSVGGRRRIVWSKTSSEHSRGKPARRRTSRARAIVVHHRHYHHSGGRVRAIGFQAALTRALFREFAFTLAGGPSSISGSSAHAVTDYSSRLLARPITARGAFHGWSTLLRRNQSASLRKNVGRYAVACGRSYTVWSMRHRLPRAHVPGLAGRAGTQRGPGLVFGRLDVPPTATARALNP